jgi:hypothetical protein
VKAVHVRQGSEADISAASAHGSFGPRPGVSRPEVVSSQMIAVLSNSRSCRSRRLRAPQPAIVGSPGAFLCAPTGRKDPECWPNRHGGSQPDPDRRTVDGAQYDQSAIGVVPWVGELRCGLLGERPPALVALGIAPRGLISGRGQFLRDRSSRVSVTEGSSGVCHSSLRSQTELILLSSSWRNPDSLHDLWQVMVFL